MRLLSFHLLSVLLLAAGAFAAEKPASLAEVPIKDLLTTDETTAIVRQLAQREKRHGVTGVFGFYHIPGVDPRVTLMQADSTVGDSLQEVFRQDPRYRMVLTGHAYVIDILPSDPNTKGHEVLELRLQHLDIEADEWPGNLIANLAQYSPELSDYLDILYYKLGATARNQRVASSMLASNPPPPHFSLHLKDVTVMDALNRIAGHSLDLYDTVGNHVGDPVGLDGVRHPFPPERSFVPSGWTFELIAPGDESLTAWKAHLFKPF